jgi:hypothetical protein
MQTQANEDAAPRRFDSHRRALAAVIALAAIIVALMWLAPVPGGASDLDALPATAAVGVHSNSEAAAASGGAADTFHAGVRLDHLSREADPSPASIAAYGN